LLEVARIGDDWWCIAFELVERGIVLSIRVKDCGMPRGERIEKGVRGGPERPDSVQGVRLARRNCHSMPAGLISAWKALALARRLYRERRSNGYATKSMPRIRTHAMPPPVGENRILFFFF